MLQLRLERSGWPSIQAFPLDVRQDYQSETDRGTKQCTQIRGDGTIHCYGVGNEGNIGRYVSVVACVSNADDQRLE